MIKKLLSGVLLERDNRRRAELYNNLIRSEAKLGGTVFGPVEAGRKRQFFCLDKHTWIWHEEWQDASGVTHSQTTNYSVRPDAIVKSRADGHYQIVGADESKRLLRAAKNYRDKVSRELYGLPA